MLGFMKIGFKQVAFGGDSGGGGGGGGRDSNRSSIVTSFNNAVESVKQAFGGGDGPGSTRIPGGRSIISDGRSLLPPDSTFSDRPAVQRNLDAERKRAGERFFTPPGVKEKKDRDRDPPPPAPPPPAPPPPPPPPAPPPPPPSPVGDSGMTVAQEDRIEAAGETAAEKQRRLGLAQTIATSPRGLLAGGEGTTRRRRSLMGGGLIA